MCKFQMCKCADEQDISALTHLHINVYDILICKCANMQMNNLHICTFANLHISY